MIDNYISTDFEDSELLAFSTLNEFYLVLRKCAKILTQTDIPKDEKLISIFTFVYEKVFYYVVLDGDNVVSICNLTLKIRYKEPSI